MKRAAWTTLTQDDVPRQQLELLMGHGGGSKSMGLYRDSYGQLFKRTVEVSGAGVSVTWEVPAETFDGDRVPGAEAFADADTEEGE